MVFIFHAMNKSKCLIKYFKLFILVVNKKNIINMEELTEDNDFGLALAERPSITNQGYILFFLILLLENVRSIQ